MAEKKDMDSCRVGCSCDGMKGDHWMSHTEQVIVRHILHFMLLVFVFWAGLTLGELRAYLKADNNFGYPMNDSMMELRGKNIYPSMMGGDAGFSFPHRVSRAKAKLKILVRKKTTSPIGGCFLKDSIHKTY